MKNLLALIGLVVVVVAGAGWYLGWYKFGHEPGKIEVDVNTNKVGEDLKKGRDVVGKYLESSSKKVDADPVSRPLDPNVTWTLPQLPPLPSVPNAAPIERNPDGSLKVTGNLSPPPDFPGEARPKN